MHMADALVSTPVGATMWVVSAATVAYSVKKVSANDKDHSIAPFMGVMGAFIFAAQMINFSILGTGSSGHLGGGLLLAVLLGPWAGFLTMASVLAIQALFFGDGGLLAYGCNLFNLGFIPCLLMYPLIYRKIDAPGSSHSKGRVIWASFLGAIIGLQLGAFCVVLQTLFSNITELPFSKFVLLMQPIHLGIGIVEGFATAAVIIFVRQMQPEWGTGYDKVIPRPGQKTKLAVMVLVVAALLVGGVVSWFASSHPDGLEWAAAGTSGQEELAAPESGIHQTLANVQEKLSILPDYGFPASEEAAETSESWPAVSAGTTVSGLAGAGFLIIIALLAGTLMNRKKGYSES